MNIFGTKTIDDTFSEQDLINAGFKHEQIGLATYDVWSKGNYRVLHEAPTGRIGGAYEMQDGHTKDLRASRIREILRALENVPK